MTSVVISFAVAAGLTPVEEEAAWTAVPWVRGVTQVVRLSPAAPIPELRRMGNAIIDPAADPQTVASDIRAITGVEYAEVATERGL